MTTNKLKKDKSVLVNPAKTNVEKQFKLQITVKWLILMAFTEMRMYSFYEDIMYTHRQIMIFMKTASNFANFFAYNLHSS